VQRILEPGQIEALAQRAVPRVCLPDRTRVFAARAERLRALAGPQHAIGDYLRLMASLAEAQHRALTGFESTPPTAAQVAQARTHGMPVVQATAWPRDPRWRDVLSELCAALAALPDVPPAVRDRCDALRRAPAGQLESEADALLAVAREGIDAAAAPIMMAALQVAWVDLASRLAVDDVADLDAPGLCPVCGTLPVASVVRATPAVQGYRYLHCGLCATEWHRVRVSCTHCASTKGIFYQSIEGGSEALRAECCEQCRTYRKILYQEKDAGVEPVADDLASLALDLLLAETGYHRASGNPLLWQS